jgi:opacity protein-like surface antigen
VVLLFNKRELSMKNRILLSTLSLSILAVATVANAAPAKNNSKAVATPVASTSVSNDYGFFFKPSVGVDYQFSHINYAFDDTNQVNGDKLFNDSLHGANFHIGARVHKYVGFEAGYLWTAKASKNDILGSGLNSKIDFSGYNFDVLGYLPIDDKGKFELIGTVGVVHLTAHLTGSLLTTSPINDSETKARIGVGGQYWLTDNVNVRGIVRYQDSSGFIKDAVTANAGLNFQF